MIEEGEGKVFIIMNLLGGAMLMPWLSFLSAADYFLCVFPGINLEYYFPAIYMTVLFIGCLLTMANANTHAFTTRIPIALSSLNVALLIVPLLDYFVHMPAHHNDNTVVTGTLRSFSIAMTLFSIFLCAVCDSILQPSAYGMAAEFGKKHTQGLEAGKGTAGVVIIIIRALSKYLCAQDIRGNALGTLFFFAFSVLTLLITLVAFYALHHIPFSKARIQVYFERRTQEKEQNEGSAMNNHNVNSGKIQNDALIGIEAGDQTERDPLVHRKAQNPVYVEPIQAEDINVQAKAELSSSSSVLWEKAKRVFPRIWPFALSVFLTFTVCISCFPGLTTSLESKTLGLGDWFPLVLVACYNLGDMFGKWSPIVFSLEKRQLFFCVFIDLLFIPIFLFGLSGVGSNALARGGTGGILASDWDAIIVVHLLGVLSGVLATTAMSLGPEQVANQDKEMAGMINYAFLICGLMCGGFLGMGFGIFLT